MHGVGAGANQGFGVIEAGGFHSHQGFAGLEGRNFFVPDFDDFRTACAEGASDSPVSDRAHF